MVRPAVAPYGASYYSSPYGASYDDLLGGSSGGIGLAGGQFYPCDSPSDT